MTAYSDLVRDHFENPRNAGEIVDADAVGYETNPVCGDTMRLTLRINGRRIVEARFLASGCPAAIAASSVCTEMIRGLSLAEAEALTKEQYAAALGGLPFPLASDRDLEAARAYGVLDDGGKRSRRAVFVIDKGGAVLHVVPWFQPGNPIQYEEIFAALGFEV